LARRRKRFSDRRAITLPVWSKSCGDSCVPGVGAGGDGGFIGGIEDECPGTFAGERAPPQQPAGPAEPPGRHPPRALLDSGPPRHRGPMCRAPQRQ
ncbi:unnamed protein product, partial [Ectocarpus sp. 12 AP-2014]